MIYLLHNREQSFLNKLDDCLTVVHEYTSTTISVFTVLLLCPTTVQWQGFLSMTKWQGGKVCRLWLCFIFPLHRHHRPPVVQWLASSRFDSQVWLLKMTNSYVVLYFKSEKKKPHVQNHTIALTLCVVWTCQKFLLHLFSTHQKTLEPIIRPHPNAWNSGPLAQRPT